jgi:membrane protein YqaA with SNARE-associated domain
MIWRDFMNGFLLRLRRYIAGPLYFPLVGCVAALDNLVLIFPVDGILVASVMAFPKRWISALFWLTLGSVMGGAAVAYVFQEYGPLLLDWLHPGMRENSYWILVDGWVDRHGIWALLVVTALPVVQLPVIAITAFTGMPIHQIAICMLIGRTAKYGIFSWLASHAPALLLRIRSVRKTVAIADGSGG